MRKKLNYKTLTMTNWYNILSVIVYYRNGKPFLTRSQAVARMADRTAPVVKLTLTLTQILPGAREWDGVSAHATAAKRQ